MTQGPPWQPPPVGPAPPPWQAPAPVPPMAPAPQAAPAMPWQQPAPAAPSQAPTPAWVAPPMAQTTPPAPSGWAPAPYAAPVGPPLGAPVWGPPAAPAPGYGPPPAAQQWGPPAANPFEGIGEADVFTKTPWFPEGHDFLVELSELKGLSSKNPKTLGHTIIVIECTVLQTSAPGVLPGARFAQVLDLNLYGKPDFNAVLTALHGAQPGNKEWTAHLASQGVYSVPKIMEYIGPSQPLRGRKMSLRTVPTPSRKTPGKVYTKHYWGPVA